jgi:ATP-dependent Clp protease adaptor protein ClpS
MTTTRAAASATSAAHRTRPVATVEPDTAVAEPDTAIAEPETDVSPDRPWITIVWDDPINLMSYVTHVFMTVFGYPKAKATALMLDVHERGRAVVSSGPRERMEMDASRLHGFGLWATVSHDS